MSEPDALTDVLRRGEAVSDVDEQRALEAVAAKLFGEARALRLSRYVLLERLAAGGTAAVYVAYDPELDRKVAIKLMEPRALRGMSATEARTRLLREAQAMAKLSHDNVIPVYDVGTYGDGDQGVFVVMELVDGGDLRAWLRSHGDDWRRVLDTFVAAGRGLAAAHAAGLVHRDFKPGNVMVGRDGRVRVLDFGLVRELGEAGSRSSPSASDPGAAADATDDGRSTDAEPLTREGSVMGTPPYMAPEQHHGDELDARTDQFAFCVALYEGLYGRRPFRGRTLGELEAAKTAGEVPPAPEGSSVPARLLPILRRGLAPDPAARYRSMDELLAALTHDPGQRRRRIAVGVVIAGLTIGIVAAWTAAREREREACARHGEQLGAVWDDGARGRVRAAFLATGQPYAEDVLRTATDNVDAYAADWLARRRQTCEAALAGVSDPGALERTATCLDARLRGLAALTSLLANAEGAIVQHAVQATLELEPLASCDGAATDGALQGALDERAVAVDAELQRATVLQDAGQYAEGIEVTSAALERARALDDLRLQARAQVLLGRLHLQSSEPARAEDTLVDALTTAERSGADALAVRAQVELVRVVGFEASRPDEALRIAQQATARLDHAGGDERLRARLDYHVGLVHLGAGRYDDALRALSSALEGTERAAGPRHPATAAVLTARGVAHHRRGDMDAAAADYGRSLAIWTETVGSEHPQTAVLLNNLGNCDLDAGRHREALRRFEEAERIWRESVGPDDKRVADAVGNAGSAHAALGDHARNLELQREALAIVERRFGGEHTEVARVLTNVGIALNDLGRHDEAEHSLSRALRIYETVLGPEHPFTTHPRSGLARSHLGRGRAEQALALFEGVIARREQALGTDHPDLVDALEGHAEAATVLGRRAEAVASLERAVAIRTRPNADPLELADARFALARALAADDPPRARELARQARDAYARHETRAAEADEVDAWLRGLPR